ncbi:hypothetical protein [Mycoplasma phocoenae]|uniref:Uncharacterized protein n=1 Tax=Mycoplasma phocoenae TaxID=754517 RepID=A0A858U7V8_9MOLU|nr:hypothetical protein [Mycoplasma phocoenae]QJG66816.1 hypothetical protein HGG69_00510 [Mycoplasma phocoenae]
MAQTKEQLAKEWEEFLTNLIKIKETDPALALYTLKHEKRFTMTEVSPIVRETEQAFLIETLSDNTDYPTALTAEQLINEIKTDLVDYYFMIMYMKLKNKDITKHAADFQWFFEQKEGMHQEILTLIWNLLHEKTIDYEYKFKDIRLNPSKLSNINSNKEFFKIKETLNSMYEKNPSEGKVAIQVFAKFANMYWLDIIQENKLMSADMIINVTNVLLGNKDKTSLNAEETTLYNFFI